MHSGGGGIAGGFSITHLISSSQGLGSGVYTNYTGGYGYEVIVGSSGIDRTYYSGYSDEYNITYVPSSISTVLNSSTSASESNIRSNIAPSSEYPDFHIQIIDTVEERDHTDYLTGVERVHFSDLAVALDMEQGQNGGAIYRLYETALDRTPDAEGYGYWLYQADHGVSLVTIAQAFIESNEFLSMHGSNLSDNEFVNYLYAHGLDREPDQEGYSFWMKELGQTSANLRAEVTRPQYDEYTPINSSDRAKVLYSISESVESVDDQVHYVGLRPQYVEYLPDSM